MSSVFMTNVVTTNTVAPFFKQCRKEQFWWEREFMLWRGRKEGPHFNRNLHRSESKIRLSNSRTDRISFDLKFDFGFSRLRHLEEKGFCWFLFALE